MCDPTLKESQKRTIPLCIIHSDHLSMYKGHLGPKCVHSSEVPLYSGCLFCVLVATSKCPYFLIISYYDCIMLL